MGKIKIIVVGKIKDQYLQSGINEFLKRLKAFCELEIIEIKASKFLDNTKKAKDEENQKIIDKLKKDDFIIALDEKGKEFHSIDFSNFLSQKLDVGTHLTFVIGGAYGLNEELKLRANQLISLSKMTFTHQMVRLIFLEQIYRAFCIINNKKYHH